MKRYLFMLYLFFLAAMFGTTLALGALSAPVIFHGNEFLPDPVLTHFTSGLLMTEIFLRFNALLWFTVVLVALVEGKAGFTLRHDPVRGMAALTVIATGLLYTLYFTREILAMQAVGPAMTASEAFASVHIGAEWDFKILSAALLVLFLRRFPASGDR